jgi:signal peptidase
MTALRWTRRILDAVLVVLLAAVAVTAALTLFAPLFGGRALAIAGGSMEPAIPRGSLVLALPGAAYGVGDVVAIQSGGATPYTHRIIRLAERDGRPYFETKGDSSPGPDPQLVPLDALIGRVAFVMPYLGFLVFLVASGAGLFGLLLLGAAILALSSAVEAWEESRCPVCASGASPPPSRADAVAAPPPLTLPVAARRERAGPGARVARRERAGSVDRVAGQERVG